MPKSRVQILFNSKCEISRNKVTTIWVLQHPAGPFSSGLLCGGRGGPGVFLWRHHFCSVQVPGLHGVDEFLQLELHVYKELLPFSQFAMVGILVD